MNERLPTRRKRWASWLGVTAAYATVTLVVTYPGILHLGSRLMGWGDAWAWTWIFDWFHRAIFQGAGNLWHPTDFFFPTGFSLAAGYDGLLSIALSLPLISIFRDPIPAFNVTLLISFVTAALAMYGLALHVAKNRLAAFVAGLIFGFSPMMLARAPEHINLMFTGVLPLVALAVLRLNERRRLREAFVCAFALALAAFSSWYYGLIGGCLLVAMILYIGLTDPTFRSRRMVALIVVSVAGSMLLTLPFALPFLQSFSRSGVEAPVGALTESADLTSFFVPPPRTNVGGSIGQTIFPHYNANVTESATYLGVVELVLVAAAVWRFRRRKSFLLWVWIALVGVIFALGPVLTVFGRYAFFSGKLQIILPYAFFQFLPGASLAWAPTRFTTLAHLGIAVAASLILSTLFAKIPRAALRVTAVLLVAGIVLAEHLALPFTTSEKPTVPFFKQLGREERSFGVALLPAVATYAGAYVEMDYLQMAIRKPLTEGYINHTALTPETTRFVREGPLAAFACVPDFPPELLPRPTPVPERAAFVDRMRDVDIRYLIVYRWLLKHPRCAEAGKRIPEFFRDWPATYEDDRFLVYDLTAVPSETR